MASVKKNYIYQVSYEVLAIVLPLITAPYVTRTFGADNLGIYTYGMSIVNIFLSVARLGVVNHGSRSIAIHQTDREQRSRVFWSIYSIQAIMAIVTLASYIIYVFLFINENRDIAIILSLTVFSSILDISWMYMGMEEFKKTVLRNTLVKILSLILIFIFVHERTDLWKYALIMCGSVIVGHLSLWLGFKKHIDIIKPDSREIVRQIKPMLVLFVPTIAVTIYTIMDKVMLGSMSGTTEVAYYEYASAIVSIPLGFITSFGSVMLPRMSALVAGVSTETERKKMTNNSLMFMSFLSCAFAFGLSAVSEELIPIYYGDEFLPCITLLVFLSVKLPFMAWANAVRTQCLIPHHRDKDFIISLFVGAVVNLIINWLLIPSMAATGAAIGTIAAEAAVCIVQTVMSRNMLSTRKAGAVSLGFVLIGAIMLFAVRHVASIWAAGAIIGLFVEIVIGAVIYLLISFAFYCIFIGKCSPVEAIKTWISLKK